MNEIKVCPIGKIKNENDNVSVVLDSKFLAGLKGLKDFGRAAEFNFQEE